jgi:hypothetical protein
MFFIDYQRHESRPPNCKVWVTNHLPSGSCYIRGMIRPLALHRIWGDTHLALLKVGTANAYNWLTICFHPRIIPAALNILNPAASATAATISALEDCVSGHPLLFESSHASPGHRDSRHRPPRAARLTAIIRETKSCETKT